MIIKDKIPMFMIGYPTVSDKYNVVGGVLEGTTDVAFGDLVMFGTEANYYKAVTGLTAATQLAGFVVATNVKLADYPSNEVNVHEGDALNLLVGGFLAIQLDSGAKTADIKPNAGIKVLTASGKCTTSSISTGTIDLPNAVFTGKYETKGSNIVAEIYVK